MSGPSALARSVVKAVINGTIGFQDGLRAILGPQMTTPTIKADSGPPEPPFCRAISILTPLSMRPPSHPSVSPLHGFASRSGFGSRSVPIAEALREIIAWWRGRRTYRERTNSRRASTSPASALLMISSTLAETGLGERRNNNLSTAPRAFWAHVRGRRS